eukprot:763074-Hanusia_phi.AAC.2
MERNRRDGQGGRIGERRGEERRGEERRGEERRRREWSQGDGGGAIRRGGYKCCSAPSLLSPSRRPEDANLLADQTLSRGEEGGGRREEGGAGRRSRREEGISL